MNTKAQVANLTRIGAAAALALLVPVISGCNRQDAAAQKQAPDARKMERPSLSVATAPLRSIEMSSRVLATGTVTPWREISVGSEANGLAIREVAVEEGATVKRGDLLVQLNDATLAAEIEQQNAAIEEALATLDLAELELRRSNQLVGSNAISQQSLDARRSAVRAGTAKLAAARAMLARLSAERAKARILAVADGTISKRSVHPGMVVSTGTVLLTMIQDGRLQLDASVAEADMGAIAPGQPVRIMSPTGDALTATVREIAPLVDRSSRLGSIRIDLPEGAGLKSGMFARVEFVSTPVVALAAPRRALVWRGQDAFVFTVSELGRAEMRKVWIGRSAGDDVEIVSGLADHEQVVTAGAGFLSDGDHVAVVKALAFDPGVAAP